MAAATGPRTRKPGQDDGDGIQPEGEEEDVLADHADRLPGQANRLGQRGERVAHQDDRAGLGGQVAADAGQRQADVGPGQGRGVVDAVADHGHDPAVAPPSLDPLGLAGRRQLGLDLLDMDLLRRPRSAGAARSPVRIARSLRPRCFKSWITSCAARRTRSRAPITPDDPTVAHHDQRRLPRSVQVLERLLDLGRDGHAVLADQAEVADQDRARPVAPVPTAGASPGSRRPAGPGSRRPRAGRARGDGPRRRAAAPGDARWAARPRRPGGAPRPEHGPVGVIPVGSEGDAIAQLGLPFGEGAGLVEGDRIDAGEPLDRRAALDEHAAAGQPGRRGQDGRRGRQHQGARAGDDEHGQGRQQVDRRRGAGRDPSPEGRGHWSPGRRRSRRSGPRARTAGRSGRRSAPGANDAAGHRPAGGSPGRASSRRPASRPGPRAGRTG